MKVPHSILVHLALFGASCACFGQVSLNVSQPIAKQTYSTSVPIMASATSPAGITGWEIYVDNTLAFKNNDTSGQLNTSISPASGGHTVVIKAWDSASDNTADTETVTVITGPAVTLVQPANNATMGTTFTLQASCSAPAAITGWEVYIDSVTPPYFKNTSNSSSLNIPVTTTTGAHSINVKCWDTEGIFGEVNFNVTAKSTTPSVQLLTPTQGASVDSPFTLQANCSSPSAAISGWEVYIDSTTPPFFKNNTSSSSLNIPVTANLGAHSIQVKCWDVSGVSGATTFGVTVQPGGLIPTPPTTATPFPHIEDLKGWLSCADSSCSSSPPVSPMFSQNNASPSLDGSAIAASVANGPPFWGILWYKHLGPQNAATNVEAEWSFQINPGAVPQALEFDFPIWAAGKSFYFGTQCVPGNSWQYWIPGTTNHGWHNIPQAACPAVQTGVWHTLRWYGTVSANSFTYVAMEIDGKQIAVNITVPAGATNFADEFTVQFQFDGTGKGTGYSEFIDEVNAWIWH
jgi:hypothetical protein